MIQMKFSRNRRDLLLWAGVLVFSIAAGTWIALTPCALAPDPSLVSPAFMTAAGVMVAILLAYLLMVGVLALLRKPLPDWPESQLPGCTVIVPAYNEGEHVMFTLRSLLAVDFPADKLQIIAVDDGSQDDTRAWIRRAVAESRGRIESIELDRNGGKKHALYLGMKAAKFDYIVTVDSDSLVKADTLRHLIAPFQDSKIGAVAGDICAKPEETGFFASMLDVTLVFGCEYMRAGQSSAGTVFCTPGALSAYRKSAVLPVLDEWLGQMFMGLPAKIGEDRAIATLLLKRNWRIVHQNNAIATTVVPETYRGLCKMLLRWTRSDIRENLLMTRFIFEDFPMYSGRKWMMFLHWTALTMNIILPLIFVPMFVFMIAAGALHPVHFLAGNILFSLAWAMIPGVIYARRTSLAHSVWALLYGVFCPFAISWICIYSLVTMRNSDWLTRKLPGKAQAPARASLRTSVYSTLSRRLRRRSRELQYLKLRRTAEQLGRVSR